MQIDWTNQTFNSCTILEPVNPDNKTCKDRWRVKCHCGKIFTAPPLYLKYGRVKSCKCLVPIARAKARMRFNNSGGKISEEFFRRYNYTNRFGVQLIRPVDLSKDGMRDDWITLCPHHDSHTLFISNPDSVVNGLQKSCGCLN